MFIEILNLLMVYKLKKRLGNRPIFKNWMFKASFFLVVAIILFFCLTCLWLKEYKQSNLLDFNQDDASYVGTYEACTFLIIIMVIICIALEVIRACI
jgi:uncharacterized membrane protein